MAGAEDGLRWAIGFAQADLASWRKGDWLNALEGVERLVWPWEGEARESETALATMALDPVDRRKRPDVAEVEAWLTPLQAALRDLLERVERSRDDTHKLRGQAFFRPVEVPFSGAALLVAEPPFKRLQVVYAPKASSPRQQLVSGAVLRVAQLLTEVDLRRLKRCPECRRLFLAVRRQRFDTAQCGLRDRQRRFRQRTTFQRLTGQVSA
jgi:hypothetical protein